MAAEKALYAKEDRRLLHRTGESVDYPFLIILLLVLATGLTMLYSASYAQSLHFHKALQRNFRFRLRK